MTVQIYGSDYIKTALQMMKESAKRTGYVQAACYNGVAVTYSPVTQRFTVGCYGVQPQAEIPGFIMEVCK